MKQRFGAALARLDDPWSTPLASERSRLVEAAFKSRVVAEKRAFQHPTRRLDRRKNLSGAARKVLKDYLRNNVEKPYPCDAAKKRLATAAGIEIEQVSNWFVNARVRYLPRLRQELNMQPLRKKQRKQKKPRKKKSKASPITITTATIRA